MFEWLLDILLPKFCVGCGREGEYICKDCEVFLGEVENKTPELTSIWEYEGLMKKLIWKIKHGGYYHLIDELTAKAVEKMDLNLPEGIVVTYVPVSKKRGKDRGFNQAECIARKLGVMVKRKVLPLLEKTKDSFPQDELPPEFRLENVADAFAFKGSLIPEKVLLVDDYYITGSTANECVKVLREAGVKDVWVFTLARQLRM